jgi:dolichol-phosphate hexosyltransferase
LPAAQPASEPGRIDTASPYGLLRGGWECESQNTVHFEPWPRFFSTPPMKLSILMPSYNEGGTIVQAITEILNTDYPCRIELIVVDDGSTDETGLLLSRIRDDRVIVHRHPVNKGKGAALLSAASLATGTYLIPFDADLEYVAKDIPRLLEPVLSGRCSVVYGTRLFGYNTVYQSYRYALGNRLLTFLAGILFNASLNDLHTCLKLIPAAMLKELRCREVGFGLDTEVTAMLLRRGVRPFEVPVSYHSRSHAQGKKITWRDAIRCVWILLRVRFWSRAYRSSADVPDRVATYCDMVSSVHSDGRHMSPPAGLGTGDAELVQVRDEPSRSLSGAAACGDDH